jgi:hypothetical protein
MEKDLRDIVEHIDSFEPSLDSQTGFGGGGFSLESWHWILAQLEELGWTRTDERFGDGPRSFERGLQDVCLVKPWTETHDWGVRLYRGERTDERFLGTITFWSEPVALEVDPGRFKCVGPGALDLFSEPAALAPKPIGQALVEAVCELSGYRVNWANAESIEWTGPDDDWQRAAKAGLLLERALPGWVTVLERERYHQTASLTLYCPNVGDQLPKGFEVGRFLEPLVRIRGQGLALAA